MKIINGKELGFMPNGTVFSDIIDMDFDPRDMKYVSDVSINGLHILCGHDSHYFPESSGKFNGVLHMLGDVTCFNTEVDNERTDWDSINDTDHSDYSEKDYVVVYEKEEVENIIKHLQWALNGCNEENQMKKEVSVEKLIKTFEDMANRESLLARGNISQQDLLTQIKGAIVHVAMEDEETEDDKE